MSSISRAFLGTSIKAGISSPPPQTKETQRPYSDFWASKSDATITEAGHIQHMITGKDANLVTKVLHVPYALLQGAINATKGDNGLNQISKEGIISGFHGLEFLKSFRKAGLREIGKAGYNKKGKMPFRQSLQAGYSDLGSSNEAKQARKLARKQLSGRALNSNPTVQAESKQHKTQKGRIYKSLSTVRNYKDLEVALTRVMRMTAPKTIKID